MKHEDYYFAEALYNEYMSGVKRVLLMARETESGQFEIPGYVYKCLTDESSHPFGSGLKLGHYLNKVDQVMNKIKEE